MKMPIAIFVTMCTMFIIVYFAVGIFTEIDSEVDVGGSDYEDAYNMTQSSTSMTMMLMNYILLALMLFFIVVIAMAFMKYV